MVQFLSLIERLYVLELFQAMGSLFLLAEKARLPVNCFGTDICNPYRMYAVDSASVVGSILDLQMGDLIFFHFTSADSMKILIPDLSLF